MKLVRNEPTRTFIIINTPGVDVPERTVHTDTMTDTRGNNSYD